jgi:hypothetical protein
LVGWVTNPPYYYSKEELIAEMGASRLNSLRDIYMIESTNFNK